MALANARAVLPVHWRCVSRLYAPRTRADFKQLRLEFIAVPALDAPVLVFDEGGGPVKWVDSYNGRELHSSIELSEVRADSIQYMRSSEGEARSKLAKRIRRRWSALCDHAIGYGWPDDSESIFLFEELQP